MQKLDKTQLSNIISQAKKSFIYGYTIRVLINAIPYLIKLIRRKTLPFPFWKILLNEKNFRLAFFISLLTILRKIFSLSIKNNCPHQTKINKIQSFIAGFLAGFLSLLILKKDERSLWALYLLSRSIDTLIQSQKNKEQIWKLIFNFFQNFNSIDYYFWIIFPVMQLVLAYAFFYERECLSPSMNGLYKKFSFFDVRDWSLLHTFNQVYARRTYQNK